jgi:hypothetical protein
MHLLQQREEEGRKSTKGLHNSRSIQCNRMQQYNIVFLAACFPDVSIPMMETAHSCRIYEDFLRVHGIISQKIVLFILIIEKTKDPAVLLNVP